MLTSLIVAIVVGVATALIACVIAYVASRDDEDDPMQQVIGDAPHMDVDVSSVASAKEENWK